MRIEVWASDRPEVKMLIHTYTPEEFAQVDLVAMMQAGVLILLRPVE